MLKSVSLAHRSAYDDLSDPSLGKAAEVIEIRVEKGGLTAADYKLHNVLLYYAQSGLRAGIATTHTIPTNLARGSHNGNERLRESLLRLQSAKVMFDYFRRGRRAVGSAVLLSSFVIEDGVLHYEFPKVIPALFRNPAVLAQIRLRYVERLRSKYSIRLYELLQVRAGREETWRASPAQVMDALDAESSLRKRFSNFAQRALRPAVEEVNRTTDLTIELELVRSGQQVTGVNFHIRRKSPDEEAALERRFAEELATPVLDLPAA